MENCGSLAGYKVIDLSRLLPGPYCSMILADHGARVIAIEDKRFQKDNLFLSNLYRNKEHICLNLKSEPGLNIFYKLVEDADVLIEGFRPGVVERLGIDYNSVQKINQNIIYCSISGYGQTGSYKNRVGHDVNYLSCAGVLDLTGIKDKTPIIPGVQIADLVGGGLNGVIGIILALLAREKKGKGQYIDISMTDGVVSLLPLVLFFRNLTGQVPKRGEMLTSHRFACYNTYETADGKYISVGALEHRFWKNLCEHLNCPQYISLQYDEERRHEIKEALQNIFKQKPLDEWEKEMQNLDVCCEGIRTFEEMLTHPLFKEREMVCDFPDESGKNVPTLGVPVKLSETPGSLRTRPVRFGQNTSSVLKEMGYSADEINNLEKNGII